MSAKISAEELSTAGDKYLGVSYGIMDCQAFVERCMADCGLKVDLAGSNAWYRKMSWKGSPEECRKKFGYIPVGAFLFIHAFDGGEEDRGYHDGLGNASHIGIKTGRGEGAIHSSQSRGCVCQSKFKDKTIRGGWNCIGLWKMIDYGDKINGLLGGPEDEAVNTMKRAIVRSENGLGVNLRAQKSTGSELLAKIPEGTTLDVLEEGERWCRVSWGGRTGYAMSEFLMILSEDPDASSPVNNNDGTGGAETVLLAIPKNAAYALQNALNSQLGLG